MVQASPVFAQTPPSFIKFFSPATVEQGGTSRLIFTIFNFNIFPPIRVRSLAFDDVFPDGLVVADPPNASSNCNGRLTAAAGTSTVSLSGGSVGSFGCRIAVDVQALRAGTLENRSGPLTLQSVGRRGAPESHGVLDGR